MKGSGKARNGQSSRCNGGVPTVLVAAAVTPPLALSDGVRGGWPLGNDVAGGNGREGAGEADKDTATAVSTTATAAAGETVGPSRPASPLS